ncbi:filamentous hemagglutinin N-terminal domain-containing protein [Calothrix membranacea FACHB-236]|nr:filamentous hemagglutinin N-terminal domain-containing protein [Calothrix membranacea FACHB-236]
MITVQPKLILCSLILLSSTPAYSQINPDNTLGAESSRITPNVLINGANADKIDGGAVRGSNLFHSFSEFNINDRQRVYFGNPAGVQNILTRVTGGQGSNILGTLGVDGIANLFLINPNGILFGQNARLDVRGSFVGTTANALQFGNQGIFSATNPQAALLLTINPSALLFNQINQNAAIQNNSIAPAGKDTLGFNALGLRVPDGKSLLLVGGNVSINGGQLNAYGGRVELGGLAESGNINLLFNGDNLSLGFPENITRADVSFTNARVFVTGSGGGNIAVNARNLKILGGSLLSTSIGLGLRTPETVVGDITLNATGEMVISDSTIRNFVRSGEKGNGGNISIYADDFSLRDGALLVASTYGQGNAGNVTVAAKDAVAIANKAYIFSRVETGGIGQGGNITIDAGNFSLRDTAGLTTATFGQGNAGNVTVTAKNAVAIANNASILSTVEAGGIGQGGNIDINAATLSLFDGAQLQTITRGASKTQPAGRGDAGNVNVKVTGIVDIAGSNNDRLSSIRSNVEKGTVGNGGDITIYADNFLLRDGAQLLASTFGQGNAGIIKVNATDFFTISSTSFNLNSGLFVNSESRTGTAGDIIVTSPKVTLDNSGTLKAESTSGNGGNINLNNGLLLLRRGAQISTNAGKAETGGDGGNINIYSTFIVALPNENSDISANAFTGKGGNVNISTQAIFGIEPRPQLTNQSDITASSQLGVQGQITITQPEVQPPQKLIELPTGLVDASTKFAQTCPRGPNAKPLGSFVVTGRGSLPPNSFEPLALTTSLSPLASLDGENVDTKQRIVKTDAQTRVKEDVGNSSQIVEAQGLVKTADGNIMLVAEVPTATPAGISSSAMCPKS